MASKRRLRRRACENKQAYSQEAAWAAARRVNKGKFGAGNQFHTAYKCSNCSNWHVGRRNRKQQQRVNHSRKTRR